jgi:O-antigen ligase
VLWPPAILFLLVVIWIMIQQTSALAHPLWGLASDALGEPLRPRMSIAPEAGLASLIRLLSFAGAFWLGLQFGRDSERAYLFLRWFVFASGLYALYGLANYIAGNNYLLFYQRTSYLRDVTGTFVNRNSYATFCGMGLIVAIALFIRSFTRNLRTSDPTVHVVVRLLTQIKGRAAVYLLVIFLCLMALLQSHSRMGFVATSCGTITLLLIGRTLGGWKSRLLATAILSLLIVAMLASSSGNRLVERLNGTDTVDRLPLFRIANRAIDSTFWQGQGYGSFAGVLPMFRDMDLPGDRFYTLAHNTYLELAVEIGVPATLAILLAVGWLVCLCLAGAYARSRDAIIPSATFAIAILVLSHALLDFSVQITAVGCVFAALLGIGNAQAWETKRGPKAGSPALRTDAIA